MRASRRRNSSSGDEPSGRTTIRLAMTPARAVNRTLLSWNLVVLLPLDRGWHHSCTQAATGPSICLKGLQLYRALIVIALPPPLRPAGRDRKVRRVIRGQKAPRAPEARPDRRDRPVPLEHPRPCGSSAQAAMQQAARPSAAMTRCCSLPIAAPPGMQPLFRPSAPHRVVPATRRTIRWSRPA
jgi:hypothetical protein